MDGNCDHRGVDPALVSVALAVAVGVASGALTSLAGAGGGTLSTAGVRATGTSPTLAIGSTIPAMLPSAIVGSLRYAKAGLVNWRVALATGGVGAVLAIGGAVVSSMVDAHYLMLVCAAILAATGVSILRGAAAPGVDDADPAAPSPSSLKAVLVGGLGGFVAGLLGVGGGLIVVPAFSRILRMPLRTAVGSSLVTVAIISVPAVIAHSLYGQIDWRVAFALVVGVVPGARIGSRLALLASEATMAAVCGTVLVVVAGLQAVTEVSSLIH
jgi:uncharacterized membrane protein YfcA